MFEFGRDVCGDLVNTERREWLATNGLIPLQKGSQNKGIITVVNF